MWPICKIHARNGIRRAGEYSTHRSIIILRIRVVAAARRHCVTHILIYRPTIIQIFYATVNVKAVYISINVFLYENGSVSFEFQKNIN